MSTPTQPVGAPAPYSPQASQVSNGRESSGGLSTNKLVWIGVGVVLGIVLLKQLPQARRYMRLESM